MFENANWDLDIDTIKHRLNSVKKRETIKFLDLVVLFPEIRLEYFMYAVPFYLPIRKGGVKLTDQQLYDFLQSPKNIRLDVTQRRFDANSYETAARSARVALKKATFSKQYTTYFVQFKGEIVWGGSALISSKNYYEYLAKLRKYALQKFTYYESISVKNSRMYNLQLTTDELVMLREGVISKSVLAKSRRLEKSHRTFNQII